MIRYLIGFVFASSLAVAGGYVLYLQLFYSTEINSGYITGAIVFGLIGVGWLLTDYVGPAIAWLFYGKGPDA